MPDKMVAPKNQQPSDVLGPAPPPADTVRRSTPSTDPSLDLARAIHALSIARPREAEALLRDPHFLGGRGASLLQAAARGAPAPEDEEEGSEEEGEEEGAYDPVPGGLLVPGHAGPMTRPLGGGELMPGFIVDKESQSKKRRRRRNRKKAADDIFARILRGFPTTTLRSSAMSDPLALMAPGLALGQLGLLHQGLMGGMGPSFQPPGPSPLNPLINPALLGLPGMGGMGMHVNPALLQGADPSLLMLQVQAQAQALAQQAALMQAQAQQRYAPHGSGPAPYPYFHSTGGMGSGGMLGPHGAAPAFLGAAAVAQPGQPPVQSRIRQLPY